MRLILQPHDGIEPVLAAIARARVCIDIAVFRLDIRELLRALGAAVARGVTVHVLVAHTNKGDEKGLRRLEQDLLEAGATVSRTADDLVRYHGKMMVIDRRILHLYGFNLTRLDINKSRSFGVVSTSKSIVQQAMTLFAADAGRQPYTADHPRLIVSPVNARKRLSAFIKGARRQLLIYDLDVSDPRLTRLLAERQQKGVEVRIIGCTKAGGGLTGERFPGKRLHVRAIIRDGRRAFVGSQSLRTLELDRRREVGVFVHERPVVKQMIATFEQDWAQTEAGRAAAVLAAATKVAQDAVDKAKEAASDALALSERSEKAAREAREAAEAAAREAKEAAREAEVAAESLDGGAARDAKTIVQEVRAAAKEAKSVVKEATAALT